MDVTETEQITARTMEKVVVHPLVLRNIVDNYDRVAEKSGKRLVGVLLGESSGGIVEVVNSYHDANPPTPKRLTLGGVSYVDAMESYLEFYKKQVRISVEGYDMSLRAPDLYISLENHFSSCGTVEFVEVPRDPVTKAISGRSSTVALRGEGAEEKALALNGSDLGGWRASVKILPPALASLRSGLTTREAARQYIAHFKRNKSLGITVKGCDHSLCEADAKRALVNHFSSCGEITDVFVFKRRALVYFFGFGAVEKALKLCKPSQRRVTGKSFRARAMPIPKRLFVHGPRDCLDTPTW